MKRFALCWLAFALALLVPASDGPRLADGGAPVARAQVASAPAMLRASGIELPLAARGIAPAKGGAGALPVQAVRIDPPWLSPAAAAPIDRAGPLRPRSGLRPYSARAPPASA